MPVKYQYQNKSYRQVASAFKKVLKIEKVKQNEKLPGAFIFFWWEQKAMTSTIEKIWSFKEINILSILLY